MANLEHLAIQVNQENMDTLVDQESLANEDHQERWL